VDKETIWIINQYASTPETGMGGRHFYFASELVKQGYTVYLIAASYTHLLHHPPPVTKSFTIELVDGIHFIWAKVPAYEGAHNYKRVLNWFRFAWKLGKLPKLIKQKPHVIWYSSPALIGFLGARHLVKKFHCKLVFDVRDIWPLTLIELGGYSSSHPFIKLMQWIEDRAYFSSDKVTSNWPYAIEHMALRGLDRSKFFWLPNGFFMQEFSEKPLLPNNIMDKLPKGKFIVGYTGTLGKANALDVLLEVATELKEHTGIAFVIVGGGAGELDFQREINRRGLKNIYMIGSISKKNIPAVLAEFDVCYVGFRKARLYDYGSSLNKLPEYLMSGRPIIYSIDSPFKPVTDANAGITVPAEDHKAIAEAIITLQAMSPEQRKQLGENGKRYAEQNLDYAKLAENFANLLFEKNV
jgi:glycosyltransferase involved in cell wall biosynthesis